MFDSFLYCSSKQGLIIINLAVTNILAVIASVGSTLNICNWLNMFCFETRCFSSITLRHDGGKFVENFSTIKKLLRAVSRTSAQFTNKVRKRTGELGSTQLSELRLVEFSIRSRRFYEIKFGGSTEIIYKGLVLVQFTFILQISIFKMSRIPKIEKFRGDNSVDFKIWITQFEGHLRVLEIENDKRLVEILQLRARFQTASFS